MPQRTRWEVRNNWGCSQGLRRQGGRPNKAMGKDLIQGLNLPCESRVMM